MQAFFQTKK